MHSLSNPRTVFRTDQSHYQGLLSFCEENKTQVLSTIPFFASEVAYHCGFAALFALVSRAGGTKIYVPKTPRRGAPDLGMDAACMAWLTSAYGGQRCEIPSCDRLFELYRRRMAKRLEASGKTKVQIARELGVSIRTVQRWLNRLPPQQPPPRRDHARPV